MPLQTKFMAQLDRYSADLTKLFSKRGGAAGKKIRHIMERTAQVYELCHLVVDTVRAWLSNAMSKHGTRKAKSGLKCRDILHEDR